MDLTGQTFGRLTVLRRVENGGSQAQARYLCRCSCEKRTETVVFGYCLKNGNTRSCGCVRRESSRRNGHARSKRRALSITDDALRALCEEENLSTRAIAQRFSVSRQTVVDWLKEAGVSPRSCHCGSKNAREGNSPPGVSVST